MRALGYRRLSKDEPNGHSLEAQEHAIRQECARRSWELVDVLTDDGLSGKLPPEKRPALLECLRRLRNGEADALVIGRLDRLSRRNLDLAKLVEETQKPRTIGTGRKRKKLPAWAVVPCDFPSLDTTTASGRMMAGQFGVFAQFERDLISERTKAALERVRARGIKLGKQSTIPQKIVDRIVRARDRGESWWQIAAGLQADAVPTGQGGLRWYASSVRSVYVRAMTGKAPR